MKGEALKGHLDMLLLAALQRGPAHGYALVEGMERLSGERLQVPEGTIYPALHRLERGGLISSEWSEAGSRKRRVYALTPAGEEALAQYRQDWKGFAEGVNALLTVGD